MLQAQALARFAPFAVDAAAAPKRVATTSATNPTPPRAGPSIHPATVAEIQRSLSVLGHDPGPADGQMGPRTRAAIAAYRRSAGLMADGWPTDELAEHLRAALASRSDAKPAASASSTASGRQPPPPPPPSSSSPPPPPPPKETDSLLLPDLPALDE